MTALPISSLSLPKSSKPVCHLCGAAARYTCQQTPVSFCTLEHFHQDWKGIRHLLIDETRSLQSSLAPAPSLLSIIRTVSLNACHKWLILSDYPSALAAALQALKTCTTPHDLVTCYLLLAEANLGLNKLSDAESALAVVQLNLNKHPDLALLSKLQRNLGRLFQRQGKQQNALRAFAGDVLYCTRNFGIATFETAAAFFNLGQAFADGSAALRCYKKALEIYKATGHGREDIEVQEAIGIVNAIKVAAIGEREVQGDVETALAVLLGRREHAEVALLLYEEAGKVKKLADVSKLLLDL
jgi:tetratricopeptide (TPR) repeat protein